MVLHGEDLLKNLTDAHARMNNSHYRHVEKLQLFAENVSGSSYLILFAGTLVSLLVFLATIFMLNFSETERRQAEAVRASLETQLRESQKMQAVGTLAAVASRTTSITCWRPF